MKNLLNFLKNLSLNSHEFSLRKNDETSVKFAFKYFKISHQGDIKIH